MEEIFKAIQTASSQNVDVVALPENFAFMGNEKKRLELAEQISSTVEVSLQKWAHEFGVYILGGGYPVPAGDGRVFNRARLINPQGKTIALYDKIHLFDVDLSEKEVYRESDMVQAGRDVVIADLPEFEMKAGLSICYDVRFPELYREMTKQGAYLFFVPAAFTKPTGQAHWHTLLRARAIENSAFVIAPAQTGKHGEKRKTYGHALIIDPWGNILAEAGDQPEIITAELDMDQLKEIRRKLPALEHRIL